MKKLLFIILLSLFQHEVRAQHFTLTMIHPPCDSDGIVVAILDSSYTPYGTYIAGFVWGWQPPGGPYLCYDTHSLYGATTDTFRYYPGGQMVVMADTCFCSWWYGSTDTINTNLPFVVTDSGTSALCPSLGILGATISGATGPFSYQWYTQDTSLWGTYTYITTDSIIATSNPAHVPTGNYFIKVKDSATGCVSGFSKPFVSIVVALDFTDSLITSPAYCPALGSAIAIITGGVTPINTTWTNQATGIIVSTSDTANLPAGIYTEHITDGIGCQAIKIATILYVPDYTDSLNTIPALCPATGKAIAIVTGGVAPFTTIWTNTTTSSIVSTSDTADVPAGTYTLEITDAVGCIATNAVYIPYIPDLSATVTTTPAYCTNGTASVTITGGTAPYSYLWSTGATTASISGLVTGSYYLTLTDANGCVDSAAIDAGLTGVVVQGITITAPDVVAPVTCTSADGSITAFGSGGTAPYSYLWSNGGTTQTISGLTSSYYNVTVTDANGCVGTGGDYVSTSTPITATYSTTASSCTAPTGTATLSVSGGTAPYTITWYTTPTQYGTTATGLTASNYFFSITDASGCTQSGAVTIPPTDVITLSFISSPATCLAADGTVSVSATGGVAPYTYSWNTGGATAALTAVASNTYYATVTDVNGCSVTSCQHVSYTTPLELGISSTPASCLYTANGTITATAMLGTPPYSFSIGGSSASSVTVPGVATGPYWVYVTDSLGCTAEAYTYVDYNAADSSCFCVVKGIVYDDINQNCIQDAGELGIQNIQLQASGFGFTYTDSNGNYTFLLPNGSYTISQTILAMYPLSPCQANNISYTPTAATGCYLYVNFADTLTPIHDMHISTWSYSFPRPGFPYTQVAVITNDGTVTEPNILASYDPDGQIYSPAFVPSGILTGAPYYYSTPAAALSLAPGASQQFLVNYNVPADVPLGTNVIFKDSVAYAPPMANWLNDYSPWNNVNYYTATTAGSFDPNFKEVSPKGVGPAGTITTDDSVLEYMVHFQNTGSYMAQNIVVKDTLDANLDWATLHPTYMSHTGTVNVTENGVATFTFNNINLPDSLAEPVTSNALFTYTIKQRHTLAPGTQIKNRASIYFDFNAPVVTNKTLNTIATPAAVAAISSAKGSDAFSLMPNPAKNIFTVDVDIDGEGTYGLKVCDVTGKTKLSKTLSLQKGKQQIPVDAQSLPPGIYFVTLTSSDNTSWTQKLVILK